MSQIESKRRLLQGLQAEFSRAEYTGKNESGFRPIGTSVLILMDQCSEASSGGIMLAPETIEKMNSASESGVIASVGDAAFRYYDDGSKWVDYKPQPGDRVFTERYAGRELRGFDGKTYRMMTYTCIAGIEDGPKPSEVGGFVGNDRRSTKAVGKKPAAKKKG